MGSTSMLAKDFITLQYLLLKSAIMDNRGIA